MHRVGSATSGAPSSSRMWLVVVVIVSPVGGSKGKINNREVWAG